MLTEECVLYIYISYKYIRIVEIKSICIYIILFIYIYAHRKKVRDGSTKISHEKLSPLCARKLPC